MLLFCQEVIKYRSIILINSLDLLNNILLNDLYVITCIYIKCSDMPLINYNVLTAMFLAGTPSTLWQIQKQDWGEDRPKKSDHFQKFQNGLVIIDLNNS